MAGTTEERLKYFIEAVWAGRSETSQASSDIKATGEAYKSARQSLMGLEGGTKSLTGAMQSASGTYSHQAALQNKIALAMAQAEKAAERLARAQAALDKNINPEKQEQLALAALRAQVAFDRKGASVERLTRQLDALNAEAAETTGSFDQTAQATESGATGIEAFAGKLAGLAPIAAIATTALVAAKKVFDFSQEGAKLNDLTDSFERMNDEVWRSPDLLDRMRQATRGTVTDVQLMQGLLTLTAGTTREVSEAFADAAPDLLEIAKAANKLNPALGDTSFLYESLATGIKRGSPAILDNLGIIVKLEEAQRKYADSLGISTDQLTGEQKTMALLNAVREKGQILIQQVGGDVAAEADSWAKLTTKIENTTNAWKQHVAEGLIPVMEALSGEYQEIRQREIELARASGDLNKINADNVEGLAYIARQLAWTSQSYAEYEKAVYQLSEEQRQAMIARQMLSQEYYDAAQVEEEYNLRQARTTELETERTKGAEALARMLEPLRKAQEAAADSAETLAAKTGASTIAIRDGTGAIIGYVGMTADMSAGIKSAALSARELAGATYEAKAAADESLPGIREDWLKIFGATTSAKDLLQGYKGLLTGAETYEMQQSLVDLAEKWGIITSEEADAQRQLLEMQETNDRIINNMSMVINANLVGAWQNAWSAAHSYRDLLLELESITPPSPGGYVPGSGGSPYSGGPGATDAGTGGAGAGAGGILPPGTIPPPGNGNGSGGGYGGAPPGATPQAPLTIMPVTVSGNNLSAPAQAVQIIYAPQIHNHNREATAITMALEHERRRQTLDAWMSVA